MDSDLVEQREEEKRAESHNPGGVRQSLGKSSPQKGLDVGAE